MAQVGISIGVLFEHLDEVGHVFLMTQLAKRGGGQHPVIQLLVIESRDECLATDLCG